MRTTYKCYLSSLCTLFIVTLSLFLVSCGVKKHIPDGKIVADASTARPTLGLLWSNDSLQITLNQGRQLQYYRVKSDTLYLYEAARDTTDFSTRKYTLTIPTPELLIIKYNDSLVYPIMHAEDICEYPLDVAHMGRKVVDEYEARERKKAQIKEEQIKQGTYRGGGVLNMSLLPFELWAGTYIYNAGAYQLGSDCKCETDSSEVLVLHIDGTWQRYENGTLKNCGIMRKGGNPECYEMDNHAHKTVLFLDTASLAGHIISLKEHKRRFMENIPLQYNEYRLVGKGGNGDSFMFIKVYPFREDRVIRSYFFIPGATRRFIYEGSRCGWQGERGNIEMY